MEETSKMSNSRDPKGGGSNSTSVNPFEVFSDKTDPSGAEAEKAKAKRPSKSFKRYYRFVSKFNIRFFWFIPLIVSLPFSGGGGGWEEEL